MFEHPDFDDHQHISFFCDKKAGLRAITAIHSTSSIGTSGGGCRIYPYVSDGDALRDVLRLSRAMSYKLALVGLPAGGATTVVIADPARDKSEPLLRALGRAIHRLGGKYVVAADVGTTPEDMEMIAQETPYVVGRSTTSGDTSPATGYGVYVGIKTALQHGLGRDSLDGLEVAVQGVGAVGYNMCRHLVRDGAKLWVADVNRGAVDRAVEAFGAKRVSVEEIYDLEVDVFAPCAMGSVLNDETIGRLRCKIVCGAANNQLATEKHADVLRARGILYVPDFVVNAGGIIGAGIGGAQKNYDQAQAFERTEKIAEILTEVFARAKAKDVSPHVAAVGLAKEKLASFG